ncbi:MAG: alkaline phosphatase D family protein [Rhodoferax sp.]|nr:alkaline phosphatase D family protein [Rhodoferax sp.]
MPAVTTLRLAYASCQHWEHGYYSAYRHMLAEDLDAVMFLGDYIYEYGAAALAAVRAPGTEGRRRSRWRITAPATRCTKATPTCSVCTPPARG